jgi:hypothetical protein
MQYNKDTLFNKDTQLIIGSYLNIDEISKFEEITEYKLSDNDFHTLCRYVYSDFYDKLKKLSVIVFNEVEKSIDWKDKYTVMSSINLYIYDDTYTDLEENNIIPHLYNRFCCALIIYKLYPDIYNLVKSDFSKLYVDSWENLKKFINYRICDVFFELILIPIIFELSTGNIVEFMNLLYQLKLINSHNFSFYVLDIIEYFRNNFNLNEICLKPIEFSGGIKVTEIITNCNKYLVNKYIIPSNNKECEQRKSINIKDNIILLLKFFYNTYGGIYPGIFEDINLFKWYVQFHEASVIDTCLNTEKCPNTEKYPNTPGYPNTRGILQFKDIYGNNILGSHSDTHLNEICVLLENMKLHPKYSDQIERISAIHDYIVRNIDN